MGLRGIGEVIRPQAGDLRLGQTTGFFSPLNEAWFHSLDKCVIDTMLNEVILLLMPNCSFGGAMHAVFLLHKCWGEQLASDIAGVITEEPQLWSPRALQILQPPTKNPREELVELLARAMPATLSRNVVRQRTAGEHAARAFWPDAEGANL
jgi:hypothetical protein